MRDSWNAPCDLNSDPADPPEGKGMNDLPDKLYYSIREVSEYTGIEPHVLRYWESEFPSLKPRRSRAGSRTYRKRDIEEIVRSAPAPRRGYRIDGARKALREMQKSGTKKAKKDQIAMPFQDLGGPRSWPSSRRRSGRSSS